MRRAVLLLALTAPLLVRAQATGVDRPAPAPDSRAAPSARDARTAADATLDVPPGAPGLTEEEPSLGALAVRALLALAGVVCLAVVVLRRMGRHLAPGASTSRARRLRVLERVPLDAKRALVLVDTGEQELLLATGEGGVQLLTRLGGVAAPDAPAEALRARGPTLVTGPDASVPAKVAP